MSDLDQPRLYRDLAHLWPLTSPPSDYREEAQIWLQVIAEHLGDGRPHILELGVGGGHNLSHLTASCDATAVDLSEAMLALSRRLNPEVDHHVGDMRSVRLERTFDAVLIHDAASYLLDEDDLRRAFETAAAHLRPGGLFVAAPDHFVETFTGSAAFHERHVFGGVEVVCFEYQYDPDPTDTTMELRFVFIVRDGAEVTVEHDHHVTGLMSMRRWLELMDEAGFDAAARDYPVVPEETHYLLVGTKR